MTTWSGRSHGGSNSPSFPLASPLGLAGLEFSEELETSGSPSEGKKQLPEGGCIPVEDASSICLGAQVGAAEEGKAPSWGVPLHLLPAHQPKMPLGLSEQWSV